MFRKKNEGVMIRVKSTLKEIDKAWYDLQFAKNIPVQKSSTEFSNAQVVAKSTQVMAENFCVIHNHFENEIDLTDELEIVGEHIKIVYVMRGDPDLNFDYPLAQKPQRGFLTIAKEPGCHKEARHPAGTTTDVYMIYISLDDYFRLIKKEEWGQDHEFSHRVLHGKEETSVYNYHQVNLHLQSILLQLFQVDGSASIIKHFLDLKLRELIFQIYSLEKEQLNPALKAFPDCEMVRKIDAVKKYIDENFQETPTLKQLARYASLNELKLKTGFKNRYETTIRSYIIAKKMEKALTLLKYHNSNETATLLGYQSVSHFITIFKKHYGNPPSFFIQKDKLNLLQSKPALLAGQALKK